MGCTGPTVPIVQAVEPAVIAETLDRAELAVDSGEPLTGTGFWPAVAGVKKDPALVEKYADRIASIDRRAFEPWPLIKVPLMAGTLIALAVTAAGMGLVAAAYYVEGPWAVVLFFAGFGALLGTTHGLGHLVVGAFVGIRFTHWFVGSIRQPQPGVKIDYATYLRTPPARRAWMHAAGAVTTKLVPFALLGAAIAADLPAWSVWLLIVTGVAMVVTDIVWSTKRSDWKRFGRERELAQS